MGYFLEKKSDDAGLYSLDAQQNPDEAVSRQWRRELVRAAKTRIEDDERGKNQEEHITDR